MVFWLPFLSNMFPICFINELIFKILLIIWNIVILEPHLFRTILNELFY